MKEQSPNSGLCHLFHHAVHFEYTWGLQDRIEEIPKTKDADEVPPRLKYIGLVPTERLPTELVRAIRKANAARGEADAAWDKAYAAVNGLIVKHKAALDAIHAKLWPDCPWDEGQQTMFPKKKRVTA